MPYRRHSGFVIVVCPDWGYHMHWIDQHAGSSPLDAHVRSLVNNILSSRPVTPENLRQWAEDADEMLKIVGGKEPTSRIGMLIKQVLNDPRNEEKLLPHIIRIEAPAYMLGHRAEQLQFIAQNMAVLASAHTVIIDGHSDCAGIAARCRDRFRKDQFDLQQGFMVEGAQEFANFLADNGSKETEVIAAYPSFDDTGNVLEVREITKVTATARL